MIGRKSSLDAIWIETAVQGHPPQTCVAVQVTSSKDVISANISLSRTVRVDACSRSIAIRLEYTTGTLSAPRSVDLMVTTPILKPITNIQERNANLVCQVKVVQTLYLLAAEAAMEMWHA